MKQCQGCHLYYKDEEEICAACGAALEDTEYRPPRQFLDEEPGRRTPSGWLMLALVGLPCMFALVYAIYHIVRALAG